MMRRHRPASFSRHAPPALPLPAHEQGMSVLPFLADAAGRTRVVASSGSGSAMSWGRAKLALSAPQRGQVTHHLTTQGDAARSDTSPNAATTAPRNALPAKGLARLRTRARRLSTVLTTVSGSVVVARSAAAVALACLAGLLSASAAVASSPTWTLTASATNTYFPPSTSNGGRIELTLENTGDVTASGSTSPIAIAYSLPAALQLTPVAISGGLVRAGFGNPLGKPPVISAAMNCVSATLTCTYGGQLAPGQFLAATIEVDTGGAGVGTATATASGGVDEATGEPFGASSVDQPLTVSNSRAPYAIQPASVVLGFSDANGAPETQAGGHPYQLAVSFIFNTAPGGYFGGSTPTESPKDVLVDLPPGVAANELAEPQCASSDLPGGRCPSASQIGTQAAEVPGEFVHLPTVGLYNMVPENGHTNELGFIDIGVVVRLVNSVRTDSDYGIRSSTFNLPNLLGDVLGAETQVWGTPPASVHDFQRFPVGGEETGGVPSSAAPVPFLTMPTSCGVPLVFHIYTDSWQRPGHVSASGVPDLSDPNWKVSTVTDPPLAGCEKLQSFSPHLAVAPDTAFADTPAGLTADVTVPQGSGLTDQHTLATSDLQNTVVKLPEGVAVNPGQASGLTACQTPESAMGTLNAPSCPASSQVGTDEITTPLLPDKLVGNVYILQSNPPDLKLLVAASADGVSFKIVGDVRLDPLTGQLTTTFAGTPALPFTDFKLSFNGGAHAALITPTSCGTYTTASDLTPWSSPFTPDALSSSAFAITGGPGGSACASPLPFSPSMTAGSTTDQAGGFTNFLLLLKREDGQQRVASLQFKTPEGLLGMLSKVALCGEPQAAQGTCSSVSQIGETRVGAGAGPFPLFIPQAGAPPAPIYLTGPYKGAPFGLSIVVPVIAGPFNLGTVVVRAAISVDPQTAALTISTDALPLILDGVPTDLRVINAVINRAGFMFNPTNCTPMSFSGTAQSAEGASAPLESHFQVGSCRSLEFKPNFRVSTSGRTSKANGASLDAKIVYPSVPLGANQASSQANIAKVKVDLPKQLPSRLTTLQKACLVTTFNQNPAACPAASVVGHARAITPVLPVALTGPVFFVSHGGEAFPSLVVVLQGYGVRVDLLAETFISKAGITSSTFKQLPDVPISSFELYLPEGRYSALAATVNLCKTKLAMPTTFTAQDGAVIHQSTPIAVTGCPKAKPAKRARRARKAGGAGHRHGGHGRGN